MKKGIKFRIYPTKQQKELLNQNFRSYRTINQHDSIRIAGRYIRLPKVRYVKVRQSRETGPINHATVEQTPGGKYFVVLNVDFEPEPYPETEKKVGLDVGIRNFCTDSEGNVTVNPKFL